MALVNRKAIVSEYTHMRLAASRFLCLLLLFSG